MRFGRIRVRIEIVDGSLSIGRCSEAYERGLCELRSRIAGCRVCLRVSASQRMCRGVCVC